MDKMDGVNLAFQLTTMKPRIYRLDFETNRALAHALMRIQEFYESPRFHGQVFERELVEDYYQDKYKVSYVDEWDGFNFPIRACCDFLRDFRERDQVENDVLAAIVTRAAADRALDGYVIGLAENTELCQHEMAHAMFYTDEQYRWHITDMILQEIGLDNRLGAMFQCLKDMDYAAPFWLDEVNAYLVEGFQPWLVEEGLMVADYQRVIERAKGLYGLWGGR